MAEPINIQDLIDGRLDIKSLGEAANGDENTQVITRLGETYPSAKKAIKEGIEKLFENGGLPAKGFETKDIMISEGVALPDGSYAMVTDETGVNAVNNGLYIKKAGAWVKSTYDSLGMSKIYTESAIADFKSSLFVKSVNLFNPNMATPNALISVTGAVATPGVANSYSYSELIPVKSGVTYRLIPSVGSARFEQIAMYYADKSFRSRNEAKIYINETGDYLFTPSSDIAYIRLNIKGDAFSEGLMISEGADLKTYVRYSGNKLNNISLSDVMLAEVQAKINEIDIPVSQDSAKDFIVSSKNLFNYETITPSSVISITGEILTPSKPDSYAISDFIQVKGSTQYTLSSEKEHKAAAFINVAYYTKDKVFIKRVNTASSPDPSVPFTITTPANCEYVRLNITSGAPSLHKRMFNEGAVAADYESYGAKLTGISMADDVLNQIADDIKVTSGNARAGDVPVYGWDLDTHVDLNVTDSYTISDPIYLQDISSTIVYGWFDALLAAHPDYITKTQIGVDASGVIPIYQYRFKPKQPSKDDETLLYQIPKVFLMTQHNEKLNFIYLYTLMKEVCNNWQGSEALTGLRHGVEFVVVPVGNPWGLDNRQRTNSNQVDLNRNFPVGWVKVGVIGDAGYSGEAALSESETVAIWTSMQAEKPHVFFDCHSFGAHKPNGEALWIPIVNQASLNSTVAASSKIYAQFKTKYSWLTDIDNLVRLTDSRYIKSGGLSSRSADSLGCVGGTFEAAWSLKDDPDTAAGNSKSVNLSSDFLGTMILQAIKAVIAR